jgi:phosphoheptose isomerase
MKERTKEILNSLFYRHPNLDVCKNSIISSYSMIKNCFKNHGKVMVCGNGGSAADSEHIVGELMKGFILKRPLEAKMIEMLQYCWPGDWKYLAEKLQGALPAISLVNQYALVTSLINDISADMVYAQQVNGYAKSGDVLIGISTSGNSKNIINAVMVAKVLGVKTLGFTGENGGKMKEICDLVIKVPSIVTYQVQEYHLPVYHAICAMVESEFFNE